MDSLFGILLILVLSIFLISVAFAFLSFAPWLPSRKRDLPKIFALADLKPGQIFYDLGCGDGKLVFYAAEHYKAKAIGVELVLPFYLICKIQQFLKNVSGANFKFKNLFNEDLSEADVVYIFGTPKTIRGKLKDKLIAELKSGAKVISYAFTIEGWEPTQISQLNEKSTKIYLYQK